MNKGLDLSEVGSTQIETREIAIDTAPGEMVATVRGLIASLERRGVRYCHWKSNIRLLESLSGDEDLDLLVDRRDADAFHSALIENGFKLAVSRSGVDHPGVFHAFAYDSESIKLIHLHAYFQIVTGDSLVKSYHFPIEEELLSNTSRRHGIAVPSPEADLVIFALRLALKHTSLIEVLLVKREYKAVLEELKWLLNECDQRSAEILWNKWLPGLGETMFRHLLEAVSDEGAVARRIYLGWKVAWRLRSWRRIGRLSALGSRTWRLAVKIRRKLIGGKDLSLHSGGSIIAFVGPKATGKSTLGTASARRLGAYLDVRRIHIGKPPPTTLSAIPHLLLPLGRILFSRERSGEYEKAERRRENRFSLLYVVRAILLAQDRRTALNRCARLAAAGTIVITDRYPAVTAGAIDSSRFDDQAIRACKSAFKRRLMLYERKLYAGLPRADLVIRLNAPVETAIRRDAVRLKKEGADPAAVQRRREMETEGDFRASAVEMVDTDRQLDDTLRAVMREIWAAI